MRTRMMTVAWMGSALLVGAALVWVTGPAAAIGAAPPAPRAAPLIASATVSADQTTLTLTGLNFAAAATEGAGGAPPSVSLALTPLPVTASSPTAVTATAALAARGRHVSAAAEPGRRSGRRLPRHDRRRRSPGTRRFGERGRGRRRHMAVGRTAST